MRYDVDVVDLVDTTCVQVRSVLDLAMAAAHNNISEASDFYGALWLCSEMLCKLEMDVNKWLDEGREEEKPKKKGKKKA